MGASQSSTSGEKKKILRHSKSQLSSNSCKEFHQFSELSNDIAMEIISYVAEGPFEKAEKAESTLTHVLPLVNLQFREICKSDVIWIEAMNRLATKHPDRCGAVLKTLLRAGRTNPTWSAFFNAAVDKDDFMLAAKVQKMAELDAVQISQLIASVYKSLLEDGDGDGDGDGRDERKGHTDDDVDTASENGAVQPKSIDSVKTLYLVVVKEFPFITLPVFHMRCNMLYPGVMMNLTYFEPRYRMLIQEVMEGRESTTTGAGAGELLNRPRPQFIFAHKTGPRSLKNGAKAYLVEINRCRILEGGRAHVMINPLKKVRMVNVSERGGVRNGLHDAKIKRFADPHQRRRR